MVSHQFQIMAWCYQQPPACKTSKIRFISDYLVSWEFVLMLKLRLIVGNSLHHFFLLTSLCCWHMYWNWCLRRVPSSYPWPQNISSLTFGREHEGDSSACNTGRSFVDALWWKSHLSAHIFTPNSLLVAKYSLCQSETPCLSRSSCCTCPR